MNQRKRKHIASAVSIDDHYQRESKNGYVYGGSMHPRSRHVSREDFLLLSKTFPVLKKHMVLNLKWKPTMPRHLMYHYDFTHPSATYHLSKAILKEVYNINFFLPCGCKNQSCDSVTGDKNPTDNSGFSLERNENCVFEQYLVPCVPSRANYIHHAADLLQLTNNIHNSMEYLENPVDAFHIIPKGKKVFVMDIGTGANCIYPLLGSTEYNWSFIGELAIRNETNFFLAVDVDKEALKYAKNNVKINNLEDKITIRCQNNPLYIFSGVLYSHEFVCMTLCNPPFHSSIDYTNLNPRTTTSGKESELVFSHPNLSSCSFKAVYIDDLAGPANSVAVSGQVEYFFPSNHLEHGEVAFIDIMLLESRLYAPNVLWFTSLVAKVSTLKRVKGIIRSEMRLYNSSNKNQVSFLDMIVDHFPLSSPNATERLGSFCPGGIHVSDVHVCEFRTFTLKQGKQARWIIAWTFYNAPQRYKILRKILNSKADGPAKF